MPSTLLRSALLPFLALLAACGAGDAAGQPVEERTCSCGSYEPQGEGTVATEPPC